MLAPAKVNPIDHAFDAVLAPAAVVMTDARTHAQISSTTYPRASNCVGRWGCVNR
jgi:hypothetical protein